MSQTIDEIMDEKLAEQRQEAEERKVENRLHSDADYCLAYKENGDILQMISNLIYEVNKYGHTLSNEDVLTYLKGNL